MKSGGYKTFTKLYYSCVTPVMDYNVGAWGNLNNNKGANSVFNRAIRFYMGVHKWAPIPGLHGEMGWLPPKNIEVVWRNLGFGTDW